MCIRDRAKTASGLSPASFSAMSDDLDGLIVLKEHHADFSATNDAGWSPLEYAVMMGDSVMCGYLLKNGANARHNPPNGGALAMALSRDKPKVARMLVEAGADPNFMPPGGYSAVHYAAMEDDTALLDLIVKHGGSVHLSTHDGLTPLHVAVQSGAGRAAVWLVKHGSRIDAISSMGTPCEMADKQGDPELSKQMKAAASGRR